MEQLDEDYLSRLDIDRDIYSLVVDANKLPFLSTVSSCSGHLRYSDVSDPSLIVFPEEGNVLLYGGHLMFKGDRRFGAFHSLLGDFKGLSESYPFVNLSVNHSFTRAPYSLDLAIRDLITGVDENFIRGLDLGTKEGRDLFQYHDVRAMHQVKRNEGIKRFEQFRDAWFRVREIINEYSS